MLPLLTIHNVADLNIGHPILSTEIDLTGASSISRTHIQNYLGRQLRKTVSFTSRCPTFMGAISAIVELSASKKMFWIYARGIVALVVKLKPFRNWPFVQNPRSMCSTEIFALGRIACNNTVSVFVRMTSPKPASIGFRGIFPETLMERFALTRAAAKSLWSMRFGLSEGEKLALAS